MSSPRPVISEAELIARIKGFEVVPETGVRVWPGGLATIHERGRCVSLIANRIAYVVMAASTRDIRDVR